MTAAPLDIPDEETNPPAAAKPAMPRILAIVNQKGGVGKTTTAVNLATALAAAEKRVLVIDFDPQGNASTGLGVTRQNRRVTSYDVLLGGISVIDATVETPIPRLSLVPSSVDLSGAEIELVDIAEREFRLRKALDGIAGTFDYVLIDCPPSLGLLTLNALVGSNGVIIPVQTQYYALKGVAALLKIIKTVQERLNPKLKVLGMLPTFYDSRTILGRDMLESLRDLGDHQVFRTVIRQSVKVGEAPTAGVPITVYDPKSDAAKAFIDLAKEVANAH
jgi:chromosome partitioning protein